MDDRREKLLDVYDTLTAGKQLPTAKELAKAAHETPKYARYVLRDAGLPYRLARVRAAEERRAAKETERQDLPDINDFRLPNMTRIIEIKQSGGEGAVWPQKLPRPGAEYKAEDRVMLSCPVCGRRKLIAPRMHPFWLRNRAGEVVFVDREACTGRIATSY